MFSGKHYARWKKPDTKGHVFSNSVYRKYIEKANIKTESRLVVARDQGEEVMGSDFLQGTGFLFGDEKVLELGR